jgi:uncharacterized membrane protein YphA (DoxX/SURF4 family)
LQRLFSTFPGGWPGLGLLLLRLTVGLTTAAQGISYLSTLRATTTGIWIACLLGIAVSASLLIGFLTPIVSIFAAMNSTIMALIAFPAIPVNLIDVRLETIDTIIVAMAVVFLGPGAFSVDAYLFGRREIIIPEASASPRD